MATKKSELQSSLEAERLLWSRPYWPKAELEAVIKFAEGNVEFAAALCERVAELAGGDDRLTLTLRKTLQAKRHDKPPGAKPRVDKARRYGILLTFYYQARHDGATPDEARRYAATFVAGGELWSDAVIQNNLSDARKALKPEKLPVHLREFAADDWPTHRTK